jgi:pimeloyl-ACP methyl ester carboxylesterase
MPTLTLKDCSINYEVRGSGPALLFIHGLGSCLLDWERQIAAFARTHTVIAADLRGHGDSSRPRGPYRIQTFAEDQLTLLRALQVESVDVVGLSLGGAVAFQLALDAPAMVRRLVIVNSFPEFVLRTWAQKFFIWQRIAMIKLLSFERMGKLVAKRMFPDPDMEELRTTFVKRYIKNERQPYLDSLNALFGWSVMNRLGELRCPILVIAADQDYSPVSAKEAYVRLLASAKLVVIPNSRHATPMERPEAFNRVLNDFLHQSPA